MKTQQKLSGDERRAAIIRSVSRVFAQKGFHGTTTRELAEAAGVSEALLFKHFPNKEALYAAMRVTCCPTQDPKRKEWFDKLEPSASSLVVLVHMLVSHMAARRTECDDEETLQGWLFLRSLTEDGEFARLFLQGMPGEWVKKVEQCLKAAISAGDATEGRVPLHLRGWLAHHLIVMLKIHLLPPTPVVDYGLPPEELVESVVWFVLRGMGLKDDVIARHYNPKAWVLLQR